MTVVVVNRSQKVSPGKRVPRSAELGGESNSEFQIVGGMKAKLAAMNKGLRREIRAIKPRRKFPVLTAQAPDKELRVHRSQEFRDQRHFVGRDGIDAQHRHRLGVVAE